jgi:hypothetical protein
VCYGVSRLRLLVVISGTVLTLSACATQQSLVHDDVDRLFLKYAEIAQRPSPISADEVDETGKITDRIRSDTDTCLALKFLKLVPVASLLGAGSSAAPVSAADLQVRKDEAKQYLQGLQKAPARSDCPYSGFPAVPIG